MATSLLVLSDQEYDPAWDLGPQWTVVDWVLYSKGTPDLEQFEGLDYALVVGKLSDSSTAVQLGGGLRLLVESGTTVIYLYPLAIEAQDRGFLDQLAPELPSPSAIGAPQALVTRNEAFRRYFTQYGRANSYLNPSPSGAEVLGLIDTDGNSGIHLPVGKGSIYVLPWHAASFHVSHNPLVRSLLAAIEAHGSGAVDSQPEYLEDIRLPGEQEVLDSIDSLRNEIAEKEEAASRLRRFRKLIGTASGTTLENLIIDALNVILDASDLSAEDREDVGAEDFWIIDSKGDVALAESKGIGAHVRRTNINQVDDHRDAHDLKTDDTPGLLIVNVFRNSDGEEAPKRSLPVSPDVVAHAARNNVLVLRTVDLFNLLHRRLNGADAAAEFTKGLKAGGGWLEVATESSELHQ